LQRRPRPTVRGSSRPASSSGQPGAPADARKGHAGRCDPAGGDGPGRKTRSRPAPSSPAGPKAHRGARTSPRATSRARNAAPRKRIGPAPPSRQVIPVARHGRGTGVTRLPAREIRTRTLLPLERVPGQAGSSQGRPGCSFAPPAGTSPTATSRPVTPRRVGGRHRATSKDGITEVLSDGEGQGERRLSRRYGRAPPVGVGGPARCLHDLTAARRLAQRHDCPSRHGGWPRCRQFVPGGVSWNVLSRFRKIRL